MKYTDTNIDAITGEITVTERDFTAAEIKLQKLAKEKDLERQAEDEAKAAAKAAAEGKLAALGLTTDDLRALGL